MGNLFNWKCLFGQAAVAVDSFNDDSVEGDVSDLSLFCMSCVRHSVG